MRPRTSASLVSAICCTRCASSALVKLHKDTTTSLSPSLVYSLFHYKRPHPGMRVANLQRLKRLSAPGGRLEHLFPKPAEPRAPEAD